MTLRSAPGERTATVLRRACVVSMDPSVGTLPEADVYFDADGAIVAVGTGLTVPPGVREVDASGMIAIPGFIDSHRHVWQTVLRGLATDLTVVQYRSVIRGTLAPNYQPEDVYASTLLGDLEALGSGITTMADLANISNTPEHADAALQAHRDAGMRIVYAHGTPSDHEYEAWYSGSVRRHPDDVRRIAKLVEQDPDPLVTLGMMVRPPHLVHKEVLRDDVALAHDIGAHIFVDGGVGGGCWGGKRWGDEGYRPVTDLGEADALGAGLTIVHCNNLPDDELDLIARTGTLVSTSPDAEMNCGHGIPATRQLLARGVRPSLSIDIVVQVGGDMFGAMRSTLGVIRGTAATRAYQTNTPVMSWDLTAEDVLAFATVEGAPATGLTGRVGSLSPGRRADIVLLRSDPFNLEPLNHPVGSIVMAAHPGNVDSVWIDGRQRKEAGLLLADDQEVIAAARRSRDRLVVDTSEASAHAQNWSWS